MRQQPMRGLKSVNENPEQPPNPDSKSSPENSGPDDDFVFWPSYHLEWLVGDEVRFDPWVEVDPVSGAKRTWEIEGEVDDGVFGDE